MTPTVPDVDVPRLGVEATTTSGAVDELLTVGDLLAGSRRSQVWRPGTCHIYAADDTSDSSGR
jgi:hypothetical protein